MTVRWTRRMLSKMPPVKHPAPERRCWAQPVYMDAEGRFKFRPAMPYATPALMREWMHGPIPAANNAAGPGGAGRTLVAG